MENRGNQQPSAAAQDATSYSQDSANGSSTSQSGGIMDTITSSLGNIQIPEAVKNIQMPQSVKDFGATCARSYNSLSTTQKVIGGAALAIGASYLVASKQGWIDQAKVAVKNKTSKKQHA